MDKLTMGSVNPRNNAITGAKNPGLKCIICFNFATVVFAPHNPDNQFTILLLYNNGALLIASVPPARTKSWRPVAISLMALSSACMPDAQFLCTVQAGTDFPQPNRKATTRAIFASSTLGIMQPNTTSPNSLGVKGWRDSNSRPAFTAK